MYNKGSVIEFGVRGRKHVADGCQAWRGIFFLLQPCRTETNCITWLGIVGFEKLLVQRVELSIPFVCSLDF